MFPYISLTKENEREMLDKIGVKSIDDLFKDIPSDVSLNRELDLPKAKRIGSYKISNRSCK